MKELFFTIALVLAFIATFVALTGTTSTDGRRSWLDVNFFAGAFFFYLLSIAPFIH